MDLLMEPGNDQGLSDLFNDANDLPAYVQFEGADQQQMTALIEDMFKEYHGDERYRQTLLKAKLKEILDPLRSSSVGHEAGRQKLTAKSPSQSKQPLRVANHSLYPSELSRGSGVIRSRDTVHDECIPHQRGH